MKEINSNEGQKTAVPAGQSTAPCSVDFLTERVRELEAALTEIAEISWGFDGDCGAQTIIDKVMP